MLCIVVTQFVSAVVTHCFGRMVITVCHHSAANGAAHPFPEGVAHIDSMHIPPHGLQHLGVPSTAIAHATCSRTHRRAVRLPRDANTDALHSCYKNAVPSTNVVTCIRHGTSD